MSCGAGEAIAAAADRLVSGFFAATGAAGAAALRGLGFVAALVVVAALTGFLALGAAALDLAAGLRAVLVATALGLSPLGAALLVRVATALRFEGTLFTIGPTSCLLPPDAE